jgi:DNA-directed RNA polymerase specialized sigma24 family protein
VPPGGARRDARIIAAPMSARACPDVIRRDGRRVASLESFRDVPWLQPYPDPLLDEAAPPGDEPATAVVERETIELTFLAVIQLLPPRQAETLCGHP